MTGEPPVVSFEKMMKPVDALARLPVYWKASTKREAIMWRRGDGSISAIARSCVVENARGNHRNVFAVLEPRIGPGLWNGYGRNMDGRTVKQSV